MAFFQGLQDPYDVPTRLQESPLRIHKVHMVFLRDFMINGPLSRFYEIHMMFRQDFMKALSQGLRGPYGVPRRFHDKRPSFKVYKIHMMFRQDIMRALSQDLQGPYGVPTRFQDQWLPLKVLRDPYDVLKVMSTSFHHFLSNFSDRNFKLGITC